ncbi:hypothetical protein ABW20_dc0108682 [Dactylellina cionopaga]|nr:hypothetical protein ABW20_dc0108682 [Dactylellina cionopaga]
MAAPKGHVGVVSDKFDPNREYPIGIPDKFGPDGKVRPYPGVTIECRLSNTSELHASMLSLYKKLETSHLNHLYTLLPTSSWHMTVFEGITDLARDPFPDDLPMETTLAEYTEVFRKKLESFDLQCKIPFQLSVSGFGPMQKAGVWYGIGLDIVGHTGSELATIKALRDRLADTLRYRQQWHDSYGLHMSMAYLIRKPTDAQHKELREILMNHFKEMPKYFELGAPEFCTFEDMFNFKPILTLKNKKD